MRYRAGCEKGSAMVEMAIVLPILVLLIQGIFYFGQGYVNKEKAEMAARFAAWQKITRPGSITGTPDDQIKPLVEDRYFKGETFQLKFLSREDCDAAAEEAGASLGESRGRLNEALEDLGDMAGGILGALGGLECAQVAYTYNPAFPQNLFAPGEVKGMYAVVADYYTRHEHGGVLNMAWDAVSDALGDLFSFR